MMLKKVIGLIALCGFALSNVALGQFIGYDRIDETLVQSWKANELADYNGNYHFGDSEGESNLSLYLINNKWLGQIRTANWHPQANTWVSTYIPLHNIKLSVNGDFRSDEYQGEFVIFNDSLAPQYCLKIYNSWSALPDSDAYELGWRSDQTRHVPAGDFPQASMRFLSEEELKKHTNEELILMRNEIFARYGYRFRTAGAMDKHFSSKKWYRPYFDFVGGFLSELELHNIALIRAEERSR